MAAQPDLNTVLSPVTAIHDELAKVPNMPVFNLNQTLSGIQQSLVSIQQGQAAMQQDVATMPHDIAPIQQDIVAMQAMMNQVANSSARNTNRHASLGDSLAPVLTNGGHVPAFFPITLEGIAHFDVAAVNAALAAYALPTAGTFVAKKKRLLEHLGYMNRA